MYKIKFRIIYLPSREGIGIDHDEVCTGVGGGAAQHSMREAGHFVAPLMLCLATTTNISAQTIPGSLSCEHLLSMRKLLVCISGLATLLTHQLTQEILEGYRKNLNHFAGGMGYSRKLSAIPSDFLGAVSIFHKMSWNLAGSSATEPPVKFQSGTII